MFRVLFHFFRRLAGRRKSKTKVAVAVVVLLGASTYGFYHFERSAKPELSLSDGLWWSFVTMTTVGYGDLFPVTSAGRFLVAIPTMFLGIGFLGYLLSNVAESLLEARSREVRGMKTITDRDHVLLIHYTDQNRVWQLVRELRADPATKDKAVVVVDDRLEELPLELLDQGVRFVRGNPTLNETLERANFRDATHAVVLAQDPADPRSDDLSLAVALTLENLRRDIHTVVECVDPRKVDVIRRTGCDSVVCASQFSSQLVVQELLDPGVRQVFAELSCVGEGQYVFIVDIASMDEWTYRGLQGWAAPRHLVPLGMKRGESVILNPPVDRRVLVGDRAIVIGGARPEAVTGALARPPDGP